MRESIQIGLIDLFCKEKNIIIPVIQRDYCMGSYMDADDSLLTYILNKFRKYSLNNADENKNIVLSAITVYENNENVYIYDGQQRIFTMYCLLKFIDFKIQECNCESSEDSFQNIMTQIQFQFRKAINEVFKENNDNLVTYATKSVNNLKETFNKRAVNLDFVSLKVFILKKIKFDRVSVKGELSTAEQFFIDINSGVPIVPYEIFKCLLNNKADKCINDKETKKQWFSNIDNDWLDIFYKFKEVTLVNETSREELMEMRFLEFCCRMIYWEKQLNNEQLGKHALELKSFNDTRDTDDINDTVKFIDILEVDDFDRISKILNSLETELKAEGSSENNNIVNLVGGTFNAGSQGKKRIGTLYFDTMCEENIIYIRKFLKKLCSDKCGDNNEDKEQDNSLNIERAKDLVVWAILNELVNPNIKIVKAVKNEWNKFVIYDKPIAYLTPNFVGTWKEIIYPVPQYYYDFKYDEVYESLVGKENYNEDEKNKLNDIMKIILKKENCKINLKIIPKNEPEYYDFMKIKENQIKYPEVAKYQITYKYRRCNFYKPDKKNYGILKKLNDIIIYDEDGYGYYLSVNDRFNFYKDCKYGVSRWEIKEKVKVQACIRLDKEYSIQFDAKQIN
ncbi:DUF262 domain-containing protein [Clostridium saccharobutylicum]|uniref:GmrSD restriction endonucleases N-terminal domain-containing protein n=1 Tax=Clostridium saccharobutylicum DSM 13864 TaxID=1345695 RepID=U5MN84_CLOSA|nr:DUF262 domain-containing protein [Clostridium saccharobutylicum]AGX41963.1 hypothetical protein CLSA_c09520 [Clostridium saccharobutylicum DSM 13864]AQR89243.1 hypothetical protein CLOSC_09400 [Clostridium saccharobutylicum]AQR99144.1 hypothetical protein CSACC_09470 [Clostridium saccharobutylicum]AQS08874.1 hypothetical protein CLOBY_09890 [Clostridium saccharobutylicum]AQS13132.1 hypothetical protein CLOSACC_09470 [Clostridium saccharobutylicum]